MDEEIEGQEEQSTVQKAQEKITRAQRLKRKFQALARSGKVFLRSLASLLFNPIFWIVVLVITIIFTSYMGILAFYSSIGRNDLGDDCGTNPSSSSELKLDPNMSENESAVAVMNWLTSNNFKGLGDKPMSKEQAAGVAGNMMQESTFNPKAVNSSSGASGLFQWLGGRRNSLVKFASSQGKSWEDPTVQMEFMMHELETTEKATINAFKAAESKNMSPADWSALWGYEFERFGDGEAGARDQNAERYFKLDISDGQVYAANSSSHCSNGSTSDFDDVIEMAKALSEGQVGPWDYHCGKGANPAYLAARQKQVEAGLGIGTANVCGGDYADCSKFVGTVVNNLIDKDYPPAGSWNQRDYLKASPNWEEITNFGDLQTGDVMVTKAGQAGHVIMYLGTVDGAEHMVADASLEGGNSQLPRIHANAIDSSWRETYPPYRVYHGFRYIGEPNGLNK